MKIFIRTTRAVTNFTNTPIIFSQSVALQIFKSVKSKRRVKNVQKLLFSLFCCLVSLRFSKTSSSKTSKRACASYYHIIIIIRRERERESQRESQRESERVREREREKDRKKERKCRRRNWKNHLLEEKNERET